MSNPANPNSINGNKRTTDGTVMNGSNIPPTGSDSTPDPQDDMIDQTPTCIPFNTLSDSAQYKIKRLRTSISRNWNLASPASAFPGRYLPDPDTHNWGNHLLTAIDTLTELTRGEHRDEACARVIRHMKKRNRLEGGMPDQDISGAMTMECDLVIRPEDVEESLRLMRYRFASYWPLYGDPRRGGGGSTGRQGSPGRRRRD